MKIKQAIDVLIKHNSPNRTIFRDRTNFIKLMDILGHPYKQFKSIHITGTNGKGSVALKTAKILELAGFKVGLYTSPHLFSFRQRIQVNGKKCDPNLISEAIIQINKITESNRIPISYFEFLTAAAFIYFKEEKCEYVSLEVGLGGQKDTTNIVTPILSVITSIGMDHMNVLGPTIQHISRQKAGIIKDGVPVVLGPSSQRQSIIKKAQQKNSVIYPVTGSEQSEKSFEQQNQAITMQIATILKQQYRVNLIEDNILEGIKAQQMCRFELLQQKFYPSWAAKKKIFFDVGHNSSAIKKIVATLGLMGQKITIIFGTSKEKVINEILWELEKIAENIYFIQANHSRAASLSYLQSFISQSKKPSIFRIIAEGNIHKTIQYVTADPTTQTILICGSFFIMPEARGYFQPNLVQNWEQNLNECYQMVQNIEKIN